MVKKLVVLGSILNFIDLDVIAINELCIFREIFDDEIIITGFASTDHHAAGLR